jgi:hypothetical protein
MRRQAGFSAIFLMVLFCGLTLPRAQSIAPIGSTSLITGTVWDVKNPPDPRMGMPSVLTPVPGCTVYVDQNEVMTLVPIKGVTNDAGEFSIQVPLLSAGTTVVLRSTFDHRTAEAKTILSGLQVETVDLYFNGTDTIVPPDPSGKATLYGTVVKEDGSPAAGAKLYLYPLLNGDVGITAESDIVDPGFGGGYTAVADEKGRFEIAGILIWNTISVAIYPPVPAGDHFMLYAESDGQSSEQTVFLSAGDSLGVKVQLGRSVVDPPLEGYAGLTGRVVKEEITTSGTALLTPVAACTVMVSPRYVTLLETVPAEAPVYEGDVYYAVTDAQGQFAIDKVKLWAGKAEMVVMAQKDGLFGSSDVVLTVDQTSTTDVVLSQKPWIMIDSTPGTPGDSVVIMSPEAQFFADHLDKVTTAVSPRPVKRTGSAAERISVSVQAQTLRFALESDQRVTVTAFNLSGQRIATLANGRMRAGLNAVDLQGLLGSGARGMVILRITGERFTATAKLDIF